MMKLKWMKKEISNNVAKQHDQCCQQHYKNNIKIKNIAVLKQSIPFKNYTYLF